MIPVSSSQDGTFFYIHVRPGASRKEAKGEHDGALKVSTTARAEGGSANRDVVRILADALGVKPSQVTVLSGLKSRRKKIGIEGIAGEELQKRLDAL